jgi:type I restriction enzyme, S subunit
MKKAWERKTLGEVCEVVNGGTPKTGVPEYWNGEHCWITPAEMGKRNSPYVGETERMVSDMGLGNSSARMLPPFSVILSSRAPIGHLVINTQAMATNQGCKGLVPSGAVHYKFLYYYLFSIVDLLDSLGTGATFRELSGGKLKEVEIPLPPLPEQRRIVSLLDEAFAGLATAKSNAEKNLHNARALFESHLQSVFSQRGKGWVETTLGKAYDVRDGTHDSPKYHATGYPLITSKNLKREGLSFDNIKLISEKDFREINISAVPYQLASPSNTAEACRRTRRPLHRNHPPRRHLPAKARGAGGVEKIPAPPSLQRGASVNSAAVVRFSDFLPPSIPLPSHS